jgi:hypothetical protein
MQPIFGRVSEPVHLLTEQRDSHALYLAACGVPEMDEAGVHELVRYYVDVTCEACKASAEYKRHRETWEGLE